MNKICSLPWNTISVDSRGIQRPCCNYTGINTNGGEPEWINSVASFDSFKNSQYLKNIRNDLLNNKWHSACLRCKDMEDSSIESFRQKANNRFPETYSQILKEQKDTFISIKNLELDFTNRCNAACLMCGEWSSSLWAKHNGSKEKAWSEKIDMLFDDIQEVEVIHIFGGEPLIQDEFYYFINKLIELNLAKNINLLLNTNGSMLHKKDLLDTFSKFKSVRIGISMDGIENMYNYIRWPLLWNQFHKNVNNFLSKILNKNNGFNKRISCSFSITLQTINIFNIINFLCNYDKIFIKQLPIHFLDVYFPSKLSLKYSSKKYIESSLSQIKRSNTSHFLLESLETRLKNESKKIEEPWLYKTELHNYINEMDLMRSLKLFDCFEEKNIGI